MNGAFLSSIALWRELASLSLCMSTLRIFLDRLSSVMKPAVPLREVWVEGWLKDEWPNPALVSFSREELSRRRRLAARALSSLSRRASFSVCSPGGVGGASEGQFGRRGRKGRLWKEGGSMMEFEDLHVVAERGRREREREMVRRGIWSECW